MKNLIFLLLFFIVLCSCSESNEISQDETELLPTEHTIQMNNQVIPDDLLALNTQSSEELPITMEGSFFGRFFCDRAEFFIFRNPENMLHASRAESITLFYLDGRLRQTKYILVSDITPQLVQSLGTFKIIGLDTKNKEIINTDEVLIQENNGMTLNPRLDHFEMRWSFDDTEIKYRVCLDSEERFVFWERSATYEKEFKRIERNCI